MDTFPPELARDLRAESVRPLGRGASPARVWKVTTRRDVLAVKVLARGAGMVEGQGVASFLQKPAHIRRVRRELPPLSPYYVDVLGVWEHSGWAAYAMPFVEGRAVVAPDGPPEETSGRLRHVFGVLTEHGYGRTRPAGAADQVRELHLGRIRRRLWLLEHHLRRELLDGPPVLVNGRSCRPLGRLLQAIESSPALVDLLRPRLISYPVHGDLDLGKMLAVQGRSRSFTIINPSGTRSYRDPVYDFAKSLFSLTILDRALASGLRIWRRPGRPGVATSYIVRSVDPYRHFPAMADWFVRMLGALPFGDELDRLDPHWRLRLAFSQGFHALAEAESRLSVRPPAPASGRARDPITLATGFCALGLRLLEQAIAGAAKLDTPLPDLSTGLDDDSGVVWSLPAARRQRQPAQGRA